MATIEARIGTHLWVDGAALPPDLRGYIAEALTTPNPEKPTAIREHLWGAERMLDEIPLYELNGSTLKIPRGFTSSFVAGMAASGYEISWIDERTAVARAEGVLTPIELDGYQELACVALLGGGLASAPTGAGKTVISLEAIRRSNQRAVIIVEKSSLAGQWVRAIREMLHCEPGYIGEGQWVERDITVALRQSLWAQKEQPGPLRLAPEGASAWTAQRPFWERWGFVLLDEAHHAPAETLVELLQCFPAWIRAGVSATVDRDPLTFPIAVVVIGPVIHETTFEEAEGRLVRPVVWVYKTDFDFEYVPTHKEEVWNGKKMVWKTIRNNYNEMMSELVKDPGRNYLIAQLAIREACAGHHCLIVSSRKEHLDAIEGMILLEQHDIAIHKLLGGESSEIAGLIAKQIDESPVGTILLSTVADEGLDIPRLDRLILAYPSRKTGATKQRMGRVTRRHPLKQDAVVIDIMDARMTLLRDQFRERRQLLYNPEGFEVYMPEEVVA